jgi:hypothetical protein
VRDIIDDIFVSLGFEKATFKNTLEDNFIFRGTCKINVNTGSLRSTGKTSIFGDSKSSAYEAECSAAAKAISFLESVLCIKVFDLNYGALMEKEDLLNTLLTLNAKYQSIDHQVPLEWRSMIVKLKSLLSSQIELCNQNDLDVDHSQREEICEILLDTFGDITMLYDLSTIDLDLPSL